jgi:hypothetical protein
MGRYSILTALALAASGCKTPKSEQVGPDPAIASAKSVESASTVSSGAPVGSATLTGVDREQACIDDAADRSERCRPQCDAAAGDSGSTEDCKRLCLAQFHRQQRACSQAPGEMLIPWIDIYSRGSTPPRSELARKVEDTVLSAGALCDAQTVTGNLPMLLLWALVSSEGKIEDSTAHPLENVEGTKLPACIEGRLRGASLPATGGNYSFVVPILIPSRGVASDSLPSAARPEPQSAAAARQDRRSPSGSRPISDAESRRRAKSFSEFGKGLIAARRQFGPPEASPENCEIARANLESIRSGALGREFPHLKKEPDYEKKNQELIARAQDAVRKVCR